MSLSPYQQLEQEWRRLHALRGALSLLRWDAAVMLPRGSADVRGEQLAALESEAHALLTAPRITRLLDRAQAEASGLDQWQTANLREMRRLRDHAIATPVLLISRLAKATARAESQWAAARRANDFTAFAPYLEEVLGLVRDKATLLGQALNLAPYDALVAEHSPGLSAADIDTLFRALSRRLPGLIREVGAREPAAEAEPPTGRFSLSRQRALVVEVMKAIGFPFERGRLDESEYPLTEGVSGDIRVTTRFDVNDPFSGLFGALHETGHAMYDTGAPAPWHDQPVGRDRGMALEESQALLLERIVGRSRAFVTWLQPLLVRHFAVTGPPWEAEAIYRRLTRTHRGLIRAEADELSYPLHVLHRYELEKRLLGGQLAVRELPAAWDAGMEHRIGRRPRDLREGCLQDVHWALGLVGYFPSYVVGSAIAAQLWERLRRDEPGIEAEIARGAFGGLFAWLNAQVFGWGAKLSLKELVRQATGQPLGAPALLRYLEAKYLEEPV